MAVSELLQQLYSLSTSSPDFSRTLYALIRKDDEEQYLSSLTGDALRELVDFLDDALCSIHPSDDVFRQCLRKLRAVCGTHATLPSSHIITSDIKKVGKSAVAYGGFADVWKGTLSGKSVCIKVLRIPLQDDTSDLKKSFFKEAVVWKRLKHPNIVPFLGVTTDPLQFVSEWMDNSILTDYVKKNPGANRIALLLDVAEGLNYLHSSYTMHGDLKGPNILIDGDGHARLADFGLASIVQGNDSVMATRPPGYTERWTAPEILEESSKLTREADVFSFGMVVLEAFTGKYPLSGMRGHSVTMKILAGERPAYPQGAETLGFVTPIWDMTVDCWRHAPAQRPTMAAVVEFLRECYTLYPTDPSLSKLTPWKSSGHTINPSIYRVISPVPDGNVSPTRSTVTSQGSGQSFPSVQEYTGPQGPTFNILADYSYGSRTSLEGSFSEESLTYSTSGSPRQKGTSGRRKEPQSATSGPGETEQILGKHRVYRAMSLPSQKDQSPTPPNGSGMLQKHGNNNAKRNGGKHEKHPPSLNTNPKPASVTGKWKAVVNAVRFIGFARNSSAVGPQGI